MRALLGLLTLLIGFLAIIALCQPPVQLAITPPLRAGEIVGLTIAAMTVMASGAFNIITWLDD